MIRLISGKFCCLFIGNLRLYVVLSAPVPSLGGPVHFLLIVYFHRDHVMTTLTDIAVDIVLTITLPMYICIVYIAVLLLFYTCVNCMSDSDPT